jgi:hypothetical protein
MSTTPNQIRKTRRAKLHVRKTYKSTPRKQSSFLQMFDGLTGHYDDNENKYEGFQLTYGEVTEAGIHKMAKLYQKYLPLQNVPIQNRTFYDLGCGLGKMVIGMALLSPQLRSVGIELVDNRAEQARTALSRASKHVQNRCGILTGSIFDPQYNYSNACWLYIANLCFNTENNTKLFEKLGRELPKGAVVQCSKGLENAAQFSLVLKEVARVPMTWTDDSNLHIYVKE